MLARLSNKRPERRCSLAFRKRPTSSTDRKYPSAEYRRSTPAPIGLAALWFFAAIKSLFPDVSQFLKRFANIGVDMQVCPSRFCVARASGSEPLDLSHSEPTT